MQYVELVSGATKICFHNSWTGVETVEINGRIYSKKSSVFGAQHYFVVQEESQTVNYILITKIGGDGISVKIDLIKDGIKVISDVPLPYASKPKSPAIAAKMEGIKKLKMYEVESAIESFNQALKFEKKDPEIYFNLACAYSNKENIDKAFAHLKKSIELGLSDQEIIYNHDMLAYLRIQPAFEELKQYFDQEHSSN